MAVEPASEQKNFHLHLVSDATGETINSVARACLVQFDGIEPVEHTWSLIRTPGQIEKVLGGIAAHPGPVLFTMVNEQLRTLLQDGCRRLQLPCIPVLDPVIGALGSYLGMKSSGLPGLQHELDAEYFSRIDAMSFALSHDDGQSSHSYDAADVILVGVSRTSKTPTCIYLANRGIKAANVPVVPGCPIPSELLATRRPLIIGLTKDPAQLVQIRRNRLNMLAHSEATDYVDPEIVRREVVAARRLCTENRWPVIDVSRRSIEETAATIIQMLARHRGGEAALEIMMAATVERPDDATLAAAASPVVLASASPARAALLRAAGIPIVVDAAAIDEAEVKAALCAAQAAPAAIAETLAELKAQRVSRRHAGNLVIGADQVLECGGVLFDKPPDLAAARTQLLALRGRRHQLVSAAVLVRDGQRVWHHVDRAKLTMRDFSAMFLDRYLASAGDAALSSVGAYQLEGLGAQLFAGIEGDYFTILGLPLLPLLDILREQGVSPS